mmetsp:Transcript_88244/g.189398  ORF Transcript_88244/g.189398 Transcript_88244/m.189398 type:complete len:428 (-) Transcript_88244:164-1447(-)
MRARVKAASLRSYMNCLFMGLSLCAFTNLMCTHQHDPHALWSAMVVPVWPSTSLHRPLCRPSFRMAARRNIALKARAGSEVAGPASALGTILGHLKRASQRGHLDAAELRFADYEAEASEKDDLLAAMNMVIASAAKRGDIKSAEKWFRKIEQRSLKPDIISYASVMAAAAKKGELGIAESWFKKLQAEGLRANRIVYSTLIDAAAHEGLPIAEKWFQKMQDAGFKPHTVSCTMLIKAAQLSKDLKSAEGWYTRMLDLGVEPNKLTFGALVAAAAEARDLDAAMRWFGEFESRNLVPTYPSLGALIRCCSEKGDTERVKMFIRQMRDHGYQPDVKVYNDLLFSARKNCSDKEARDIIQEMMADGVRPDQHTRDRLSRALGKERYQALCEDLNFQNHGKKNPEIIRMLQNLQDKWQDADQQSELIGGR